MEKLERRDVSHYKVEKTRKDAHLQEQVERVRSILNKSRRGTEFRQEGYMYYFMALRRKGYKTASAIYSLVEGCRDAQDPIKTLNWKVTGKG